MAAKGWPARPYLLGLLIRELTVEDCPRDAAAWFCLPHRLQPLARESKSMERRNNNWPAIYSLPAYRQIKWELAFDLGHSSDKRSSGDDNPKRIGLDCATVPDRC